VITIRVLFNPGGVYRMPRGVYIRQPDKNYGSTGKHWEMPEEAKNRIRESLTGHAVSEETRRKIGEAHKGKSTWNKGKHLSEEWKKKLSEIQKGEKSYWFGKARLEKTKEKISATMKGRPAWNKGKYHSEETKVKISEANKNEKHWNWQNGKSFEPYSIDWKETLRRSIRKRDKYICQICTIPQTDIAFDVHHIDYNKRNNNPDNLITLCHSCHSKTNLNRENWIKFFMEIAPKWGI
jgi:hypothetical protein